MRRCIHFGYAAATRRDRERTPFAIRDAAPAALISSALQDMGYVPGDTLINYPFDPDDPRDPQPLDKSLFTAEDVLFLTTRPPKDDPRVGTRKPSYWSNTELERLIFQNLLSPWFEVCSRPEVLLTDAAARINPMTRASQSMIFKVHGSELTARARINGRWRWERFPAGKAPTMGFLAYAEHLWDDGPAVLAAFGMASVPTFVWCYHLVHEYRYLLLRTPFAMAELRRGRRATSFPASTAAARDWHVSILGVAEPTHPKRAA